ncbi:related to proline transport helper PTH1 [Cephalotrichum gorgonifer]|uniref:Phosphatidate cytidylyltransferase, mitochondrial n=1 Tax=Cephalotrichum gorgonifer TaxID=2041049 RepID=A0AAE8MRR8_9PEZI|nr:related to proline transport helper PTH1 [Cephalotrichum gorgonifer]
MSSLRILTATRASPLLAIASRTPRGHLTPIHCRYSPLQRRLLASDGRNGHSASSDPKGATPGTKHEVHERRPSTSHSEASSISSTSSSASSHSTAPSTAPSFASTPAEPPTKDWEDYRYADVSGFKDLPSRTFGVNQHMLINAELKAAFTAMLRQFRAPIVFCFAYGSGVFPQGSSERSITDAEFRAVHPQPPEALLKTQKGNPKMIDFIFGVTHTEHWHWLNMRQHPEHYSGLASLGSGAVASVQEKIGAGVYFNPYVVVNGMLIKYGVTSISNLCHDLSSWETLYLAGRLHKPVKILRDNAAVRIANQQNLVGAVRTALLMLPESFTEFELFSTIAAISYLGDPRMALPTENKNKVSNIVTNNLVNFRRLYAPLVEKLPNIDYVGAGDANSAVGSPEWLESLTNHELRQDMDIAKRANMVRRLPSAFRSRLYFLYQSKFQMTRSEFLAQMEESMNEDDKGFRKQLGGEFERKIAADPDLSGMVRKAIRETGHWVNTTQSAKGLITAGFSKSWRYMGEKMKRYGEGKKKSAEKEKETTKEGGNGEEKK